MFSPINKQRLQAGLSRISGAFLLLLVGQTALAQNNVFPEKLKDGLKTYLNQDSTAFIKLNVVSQIWLRYNQSNPGTTVSGELANNTTDVGLRRTRFVVSGALTKRVFFFIQFGQNSFSYLSPRKTGAFFHDAVSEFVVAKNKLNVGIGLHGWNGPSRYANSSIASILAMDVPIYQESTNDVNDQFVRKLGIYAKGKLGKFDYRLSASKPFITQTASSPAGPLTSTATYASLNPRNAYQGYFMYQFLDQEGNAGAGTAGSYLGKKRVFNLGAGFVAQNNAMWRLGTANDTIREDMGLYALDIFYDTPINKTSGTAFTTYVSYSRYNFGKDYIRNSGPMNPGNGIKGNLGSFSGTGNAYPLMGTGNIVYAQAGYLLKKGLLGELGTLQPYASVQIGQYERLDEDMRLYNVGVNWLLYGNNSKFSLNYQNRPVFTSQPGNQIVATDRRGEYVLQYQVAF